MKINSALIASIVVVILLVVGYSLFKKPKTVSPVVIPNNTEVAVHGDSVFIDQDKTLSFSYPKEFLLDDISSNKSDWRTNTQDSGVLIARVIIPRDIQPQTNLSDSRFTVGVSANTKSAKNCLVAANGEELQGQKTINGTLYFVFTLSDAGAGNFYDTTSYRTLHDGQCYVVEYTIRSTNIGAYDPSQGIKEFDKQKVVSEFENIIRSFEFLSPDEEMPALNGKVKIEPM